MADALPTPPGSPEPGSSTPGSSTPGPSAPDSATPGPPAPDSADGPAPLWLRLAGLGVASLGAMLVALVGAFFTPFRIGSILVPVSLLLVIAGLTVVTRFAHAITEHVGLSLIPGVVWLVLSLALSAPTTEGDLVLIQQNWVAVVYILVGSVTIGVLAFRMIVPTRR